MSVKDVVKRRLRRHPAVMAAWRRTQTWRGIEPYALPTTLPLLLEHRPSNRRELETAMAALRTATVADVEHYRANLERWGHHGWDERLAEATVEITLVAAEDLAEEVTHAQSYLRWPLPAIARGLDRRRAWRLLAEHAVSHQLPGDAPAPHAREAALELRRAGAHALTAGYIGAAEALAAQALALRPHDRYAQETWANASDQLAVVRDGWTPTPRRATPAYRPRPGAVLAVLSQSLPHTSGGYATRSHGVLTGLAAQGYDVRAVTRPGFPYDRWPATDGRTVDPVDVVDGIPYHRILTNARAYPQYPLTAYVDAFAAEVERLAREHRASVIHASSFHVCGLAAQQAAARLGIPFVYEMRGLEELTKVSRDPGFADAERYALTAGLETVIARAADRTFVITAALRDLMVSRGVEAGRLVVLPNGVHADRFAPRPPDRQLAERLGVAGKTVIGYAGGLVDYEGLDVLLEAVALLHSRRDDFHLLVVGDGHHQQVIHDLAARLSLGEVVAFTGRVPHHDVASYLSLVDIAPFPRLPLPVCEAISPIKPFESMAMGKAVVVSSVAALTEIVSDGETGLVFEKGCAKDLAAALERLLDSQSLRLRLGAAARDWVRRERDWSAITGTVAATYDAVS
jgi:glycosyltransferase involved in cell wall biosynthesis